ncbi:MAG: hypothetical protein ACFFC3_01325 [Candidatus Odinarchaeota archaeon]
MKKQYYLINLFLLAILILNINITLISVFGEEQDDGINNDFEEKNRRFIEVGIGEKEIGIESIRKSETNKDEIKGNIFFDEDGFYLGLKYKSNLESDWELEFGVLFRSIIEFNDTNQNGIFDPQIDHTIQTFRLNNFKSAVYESSDISEESSLHYFKIQTINNIFTAHIYFVEEFVYIEESLINPTEAKIQIEIKNFEFIGENSLLALYTRLEHEGDFEIQEETYDEKQGYAEKESGITLNTNDFTGYFTWKDYAIINDDFKSINANEIFEDEHHEYSKGLFIIYPKGEHIYHDPKIGIENLLIPLEKPDSLIPLIVLVSVIGAVVASSAYVIHYYVKHRGTTLKLKRDREAYLDEIFENEIEEEPYDGKLALQILMMESSLEKLGLIKDINITVISEDFFEKLNRFDWEGLDRSEFILEMLALSPKERQSILDEMIEKSNLNSY